MRKHWLFASPFLAMACVLAAPAAEAREGTMNPFVKSEHYLGNGSKQVTIEQFADSPERYLRPGAYPALRLHIAKQIGVDSLSEAQFTSLLKSDKVKVVPCEGEVITGGLRANGTVGKLFRGCYAGELKVLVKGIEGNWKPGFLLGCLNPDYTAVVTVTNVTYTNTKSKDPVEEKLQSYASPAQGHQMQPFNPNLQTPIIINSNTDNGCCDDGCS